MKADKETEVRNFLGWWCRDREFGRYQITQEEELADARRPDLRFHCIGVDGPVPVELKLAEKWTGPQLFERLDNQLCGDYLRDSRSTHGIFVLLYRGGQSAWKSPDGTSLQSFDALVAELQNYWKNTLSTKFRGKVEEIKVVGIDLTKRTARKSVSANKNKKKRSSQ